MQKFLIVGCGGSGGATLAYMMDQLRSDLALRGIDRIPDGWQFVHIDVPVGDAPEAPGLGSVRDQGGAYVSTGATGISYSVLDNGVSQTLAQNNGLSNIGTWAPRSPGGVLVSISAGAGQYRAVGRMITLSKIAVVRQALEAAWQRLSAVETDAEMASLPSRVPGLGGFDPNEPPIVLVVSSMAGGAGASMALDVCRILTLIPNLNPQLTGVFMFSADIFESLPTASRSGVRANALAMLGEIVATQTGSAREHDVAMLGALGQRNGEGDPIPFQRVFPVGRYVGAQRTLFGDGTQQAVYRGLGRGLAAMLSSGKATNEFVRYDLANTGSPVGDQNQLGWGHEQWDSLPWGSFGFASLRMGRERYREYSAQRLSRTAVDRLVSGHLQPGNAEPSLQQVTRLLDSQWAHTCEVLGLPIPPADRSAIQPPQFFDWFVSTAFPRALIETQARSLVEVNIAANLPSPGGQQAAQWFPTLRQRLNERRAAVASGVSDASHRWAFGWQQQFTANVLEVVGTAVSTFGIAYATALVSRVEEHLTRVVAPGLHELSLRGPQSLTTPPDAFIAKVGAIKGAITNGQTIVDDLVAAFRVLLRDAVLAQSASVAEAIALSASRGLLDPLGAALRESLLVLEGARNKEARHQGLAFLETDLYGAWPSDADQSVPARFDVANNDVLLTKSSEYPARYEVDVANSVSELDEAVNFRAAREVVVGQIIAGTWKTAGAMAPPGGLVVQGNPWRSSVFSVNPVTKEVEVPSIASFSLRVQPAQVVSRARQFVLRPGESFDQFCRLSLRDYVIGVGEPDSVANKRPTEVVGKFREALTLARPLASVSRTAVQAVHGVEMVYRYKFSEVPFKELATIVDALESSLKGTDGVDSETSAILTRALTDNALIDHVDIFGSYQNYSPLVFDALLEPVAQEWAGLPPQGRKAFWDLRRSRPLAAALPMGEAERRAMVGGWFVGQITGQIKLPESPFTDPVTVWNPATGMWASFPNPLLTPPSSQHFASYDWLPAVMESILLAHARVHETPVLESLRPYKILRQLFDDSLLQPAGGLVRRSAFSSIVGWLASDGTVSGSPSRVTGIQPGQTAEKKAELVAAWLGSVQTLAKGFQPEVFAIRQRDHASQMPIFHDLAPDVVLQTQILIDMLPAALSEAISAPQTSETPTVRTSVAATFTLPDGGVF